MARSRTTPDPTPAKEALRDTLRAAGLRATPARLAALACLSRAKAPMSHAEVCAELAPLGFDRVTTYRNLNDLASVGLLRRADLGDHIWRFEVLGHEEHEADGHAHFTCSECGSVACLPEVVVSVKKATAVPKSVRKQNVEVQLRGVCDECT